MSVRSDAPNVGQNASAEGGKLEVVYGSGIPDHTSLRGKTRAIELVPRCCLWPNNIASSEADYLRREPAEW